MLLGIFTYGDVVFAGLALICLIVGIAKGFVAQIFGFVGFIASLVIAFFVCKPLTDAIIPLFAPLYTWVGDSLGYILALIIVFSILVLLVKIVLILLQKLFKSLIDKLKVIKAIDKILGLVLSLGILYTVFAAIIALLTIVPPEILPGVQETLYQQIYQGVILKGIYSNNFIGNWLLSLISL
ncbi:MAG TPA: CvpA family protein [Clostridia bacterium]|nr:CvpA family protein [Clostridia bacterium]